MPGTGVGLGELGRKATGALICLASAAPDAKARLQRVARGERAVRGRGEVSA